MRLANLSAVFGALLVLSTACDSKNSQQGDQLFADGDYEQAISQYTDYIEYNPEDIKSIYNRGRAYEELGQYDKSLADYEKTLEIDPKNFNALMSIGKFHFRNKDYGDAAFYFDKAVKVKERSADAHYLSGRSNHKLGETTKAMEGYNQAINLNGEYGEAYLYRGALKVFLKKKSGGCADIRKAADLEAPEATDALQEYCN
ncbi:MAG: tetratricopeptide repeat protein [Tunicatimonas sp.]